MALQNIIKEKPTFNLNFGAMNSSQSIDNELRRIKQQGLGTVDFNALRNGVKNVVDRTGKLVTVPANKLAVHYENGVNKGLWIEPSATNLVEWSDTFQVGPPWLALNNPTTSGGFSAPDGTTSALLFSTESGSSNRQWQIAGVPAGTTYTVSCFFKAGSVNFTNIRFENTAFNVANQVGINLINGTIDPPTSFITSTNIEFEGDGWYRCSVTVVTQNTGTFVVAFGTVNGPGNWYMWRAQLETGSVASSPIKTEATPVTRPADVATITDASDLIGQEQGTVVVEVDWRQISQTAILFQIIQVTGNQNQIDIRANTSNSFGLLRNSQDFSEAIFASTTYTGIVKLAFGYSSTDCVFYINGSLIGFLQGVNFNQSLAKIIVGHDISGFLQINNNLRDVKLFKQRLTNDELKILTTL